MSSLRYEQTDFLILDLEGCPNAKCESTPLVVHPGWVCVCVWGGGYRNLRVGYVCAGGGPEFPLPPK